MITFREFVERVELSESSGGERGRRRLSPRGPSSDRFERNKQRNVSSSNAALKKAGFKRSTKYMSGAKGRPTKWTETSTSSHHDTETGTYANQSDYASRSVPKGGATSTRVSKLKKIRTQLGGDRTSRPVHDVAVNKKRTYDDTPSSTMTKGRSFKKEVTKGVPDNLKKAGAKTGDIVSSTPTSDSRSRMYGRTHNTRTDRRTGKTINRVREAFDILEGRSREEAEKLRQAKDNPSDYSLNNAGSSENPNWRVVSKANRKGQSAARKTRIDSLSSPEEKEVAKRKEKHIKSRGYEAHHITPTHHSDKIKSGMTDAEWEERKKKDAKVGIYHGHHPKNLMMTRGKNTPAHKKGVEHRAGGAHEVEGKVKDIVVGSTITHRDLMAAAVKQQRQKERREKLSNK